MNLKSKALAISDLIRLPKQYGTALLLCPTLWSLFLVFDGKPNWKILFIFIAGCFLMRSAGCAVNDIADRDFDKNVARTKLRPVASKRLTVPEAITVFIVLTLTALLLVLMLNSFTVKLSLVALALAIIYPFVKRHSHFPQVFLGTAFGFGAIMSWSAVSSEIALPAILFFIANIFWATAYDTIYALMDIADDKVVGVKSTAIFFGKYVYIAIFISYTLTILTLGFAGYYGGLGLPYFWSLIVAYTIFTLILKSLTKDRSSENILKCFINNVYAGLVILVAIILNTTIFRGM